MTSSPATAAQFQASLRAAFSSRSASELKAAVLSLYSEDGRLSELTDPLQRSAPAASTESDPGSGSYPERVVAELFHHAVDDPSQVDALLRLVRAACTALQPELEERAKQARGESTWWGDWDEAEWQKRNPHLGLKEYERVAVRPSARLWGHIVELLVRRHNEALYYPEKHRYGRGEGERKAEGSIQPAFGISTPDPELYSTASTRRRQYCNAYLPTLVLVRLFALSSSAEPPSSSSTPTSNMSQAEQDDTRARIWRQLQWLLVLTCFSMPTLTPGEYLQLALLVRGCGTSVQQYLSPSSPTGPAAGVGKGYTPWMGALREPYAQWSYTEALASFRAMQTKGEEEGGMQRWMREALSEDMEFLQKEVIDAAQQAGAADLDSKELHERFKTLLSLQQ